MAEESQEQEEQKQEDVAEPEVHEDFLRESLREILAEEYGPLFELLTSKIGALESIQPKLMEVLENSQRVQAFLEKYVEDGQLDESAKKQIDENLRLKAAEEKAASLARQYAETQKAQEERVATQVYLASLRDVEKYFKAQGLNWNDYRSRVMPGEADYELGSFKANDQLTAIQLWKEAAEQLADKEADKLHKEQQEKVQVTNVRAAGTNSSQELVNRLGRGEPLSAEELKLAVAAFKSGVMPSRR